MISPPPKIFHAISSGALDKVGVTWIVPEFKWSDHADPGRSDEGPSWVADITNAIGARPSLWNHAVIVVVLGRLGWMVRQRTAANAYMEHERSGAILPRLRHPHPDADPFAVCQAGAR